MNEILINLQDLNYIERKQHPEHGRIIQTYLTQPGENVRQQAEERVREIDILLSRQLSPAEQLRTINWLKDCYSALTTNQH